MGLDLKVYFGLMLGLLGSHQYRTLLYILYVEVHAVKFFSVLQVSH